MKIDLSCPAEVRNLKIDHENGTVEASLFNISLKVITAIKYTLVLTDENGAETGQIPAELEGINLQPHTSYDLVVSAENAENAEITFNEFKFDDETVFTPTGNVVDIEPASLSDDEKQRFKRAGIDDALCYSEDKQNYWLCVCGRPNISAADSCVNCGRQKETVLSDFSSEQSLAAAILKKEEADAAYAAEQAKILAEQKAAKRAQNIAAAKKYGKLIGIIVAALIIIVGGFKLITTKIGDSAAAKGDYIKAASMYKLSGSSKFDKIAGNYYGNTSTNLMQMGIMTEDSKNVYYIDTTLNLFKESKETGEKTALGDVSGKYLNASGGSLYFINAKDENKIYKMNPDDGTSECIYDSPAYYLLTAGNDIYFIADEIKTEEEKAAEEPTAEGAEKPAAEETAAEPAAEPVAEGEEEPAEEPAAEGEEAPAEAPAEAQDGEKAEAQDAPKYPLYVLRAGSDTPEKISDANIAAFSVYKNKIYYVDFDDNYSLYSMSLSGKGAKKVVDGPVYAFEVLNNKIYYTDGSVEEGQQMPSLTLMEANLNGKNPVKKLDDAMVTKFAVSGDAVYYTDYNHQGTFYKKIADNEPETVADSVYIVNVHGDFIYYLSFEGDMYLTKIDKSGFEIVASANNAEEAPAEEAPAEAPAEAPEEAPAEAPAEEVPAEAPAETPEEAPEEAPAE